MTSGSVATVPSGRDRLSSSIAARPSTAPPYSVLGLDRTGRRTDRGGTGWAHRRPLRRCGLPASCSPVLAGEAVASTVLARTPKWCGAGPTPPLLGGPATTRPPGCSGASSSGSPACHARAGDPGRRGCVSRHGVVRLSWWSRETGAPDRTGAGSAAAHLTAAAVGARRDRAAERDGRRRDALDAAVLDHGRADGRGDGPVRRPAHVRAVPHAVPRVRLLARVVPARRRGGVTGSPGRLARDRRGRRRRRLVRAKALHAERVVGPRRRDLER